MHNPSAAVHLARVLQRLGSEHILVVHADDGIDEISIAAETRVAELKDGTVNTYTVSPEQFGLQRANLSTLKVDSVEASLAMIRSVLNNEPGPALDIVALNAGAAIYVSGLATTLTAGVDAARVSIADGSASAALRKLAEISTSV